MRGKDRWRVIGIVPPAMRERDDLTFDALAPGIRQEAGAQLDFKNCFWFSTYRIHHRAAEHFRERRCFLLGDAAHIHSPMGGQGMNTGLQDAYNLAWKLALVIRGRAGSALLDSYEAERKPVADQLLRTTDRAFQLIVSDGWLARLFRTRIMARLAAGAMTIERVRALAFRTISQTGIAYPASPLSRSLAPMLKGAPDAGDRFPWLRLTFHHGETPSDLFTTLDDTKFNLLVFGQALTGDQSLAADDLIQIHEIPQNAGNASELARAQIPQPSYFLLRPDGHIGLRGTQLDLAAVQHYLREVLRLRA